MFDIKKVETIRQAQIMKSKIKSMMREKRGYINGLTTPSELVDQELKRAREDMQELETKLINLRIKETEIDEY